MIAKPQNFDVLARAAKTSEPPPAQTSGKVPNRSEVRELEKTVDFRSQQVESCFITARIGFLPVTESVALPADQAKQDVTSSDANQSREN